MTYSMNTFDFIMDYESGALEDDALAVVVGFQMLIDSGLAWTLQGHYGRTARRLIEGGQCHHAKPVDQPDAGEPDPDRCKHGMFFSGAGACPECGGGAVP